MRLSAFLLLALLGIIVWSTVRMNRRREDARRGRGRGSDAETTYATSSGREKRNDPDHRGDSHDGDGGGSSGGGGGGGGD